MQKRDIDLRDAGLKKALQVMMAESDVDTVADLARNLEIKETTFRSAINNNSMRLADFIKVAESMGYTLIVKPMEVAVTNERTQG